MTLPKFEDAGARYAAAVRSGIRIKYFCTLSFRFELCTIPLVVCFPGWLICVEEQRIVSVEGLKVSYYMGSTKLTS